MPTSDTEDVLDEAATILQSISTGNFGQDQRRTFSLLFKGPQTAGTPRSFTLDHNASLIYVGGTGSGGFILRAPVSWTAGTFLSGGVPVGVFSTGGTFSVGNAKFYKGDTVWLDSFGSMGSGEMALLVFAVDPDVDPS